STPGSPISWAEAMRGPKPAEGSLAVPDTPPGTGAASGPDAAVGLRIPKALPLTEFPSAPAGTATRPMTTATARSAAPPRQRRRRARTPRCVRMRSPRTSQVRYWTEGSYQLCRGPGRGEYEIRNFSARLGAWRAWARDPL